MTGKNHNKRLKAHTSYHPPPYLGITCSRFGASILSAEDISGHTVTGGTTAQKTQPVNVMELFYGFIRKQAWIAFHPPPLIYNGHNQYSKSFKDPPTGSH